MLREYLASRVWTRNADVVSCPLDRKDLLKKKTPEPVPADDEEEEWDDNYG